MLLRGPALFSFMFVSVVASVSSGSSRGSVVLRFVSVVVVPVRGGVLRCFVRLLLQL